MSTEFMIEDWEALTQQFTKTFAGLGTILHNAEMASFTSKAPDVELSLIHI